MFEKTWHWIKEHPIIVMGIVGVIVLFYLLSGSSSSASSSSGGATGPSDALQAAELSANVQLAGQQAAAGVANNQTAAAVTVAGINADVQKYQTEQSANVAELGITSQTEIQKAGIQSQQVVALANDATQVAIQQSTDAVRTAQINGVVAIANAPYQVQEDTINALANANVSGVGTGNVSGSALGVAFVKSIGVKNAYITLPGGISAGRATPASNSGGIASSIASGFGALVGLL